MTGPTVINTHLGMTLDASFSDSPLMIGMGACVSARLIGSE
jgi:hypothetical protein